jgi:integrase
MRLDVPLGDEIVPVTISARAETVRLSLRTRDPSAAKVRHAQVSGYLETVWTALRNDAPAALTHKEATALAGELYRAWANGADRERTTSITRIDGRWVPSTELQEDLEAQWAAVVERWDGEMQGGDLEQPLGPLIDRLLLARGICRVDETSRSFLLSAFALALRDAFAARKRNTEGDYRPDPMAERFPAWSRPDNQPPAMPPTPSVGRADSLTQLVEDWWKEAAATGLAVSTYESYRNTMARLVAFLKHDSAGRVTTADVIAFKDFRLTELNQRTGQPISPKTVKDSDLAGLKSVFGWALGNRRMASNPALGINIKLGKKTRTRSKGFTEDEAVAVLTHASAHKSGPREDPKTAAAKRWGPWLCAYSGARIGEVVQLRKEDVRQLAGLWSANVTPEAGTVKNKEAREISLHPHLIEMGFADFVEASPDGYLFLTPSRSGEIRGSWRGVKNRVADFVREVVTDTRVAPNHAWRHLFKTIGLENGMQERVLDAICGHAPTTVGGTYGEVTLRAKANEMMKFPRFELRAD